MTEMAANPAAPRHHAKVHAQGKNCWRWGCVLTDLGYEQGYRDGESSGHADWFIALDDVLPDWAVDQTTPGRVTDYLGRLQAIVRDLGTAQAPWGEEEGCTLGDANVRNNPGGVTDERKPEDGPYLDEGNAWVVVELAKPGPHLSTDAIVSVSESAWPEETAKAIAAEQNADPVMSARYRFVAARLDPSEPV